MRRSSENTCWRSGFLFTVIIADSFLMCPEGRHFLLEISPVHGGVGIFTAQAPLSGGDTVNFPSTYASRIHIYIT
jgi:hypothetical protein